MNNAINEIKNTLEATNSRITEAEDRISELEDRLVEINESERKKEKLIKRNEDNLRDLQDNIKRYIQMHQPVALFLSEFAYREIDYRYGRHHRAEQSVTRHDDLAVDIVIDA